MEKLRRYLLTANQTARCQCPSSRMETSIGEMFTSDGEPLDGWVDELGFYGRALNAAETHARYEARQRNSAGH